MPGGAQRGGHAELVTLLVATRARCRSRRPTSAPTRAAFSRSGRVSCFESRTPRTCSGAGITAATVTGPAQAPRPTSSIPQTTSFARVPELALQPQRGAHPAGGPSRHVRCVGASAAPAAPAGGVVGGRVGGRTGAVVTAPNLPAGGGARPDARPGRFGQTGPERPVTGREGARPCPRVTPTCRHRSAPRRFRVPGLSGPATPAPVGRSAPPPPASAAARNQASRMPATRVLRHQAQ